jgi:two-component system response regulator FixJ
VLRESEILNVQGIATVCVVDDDENACTTTCKLLEAAGDLDCRGYTSPEGFLNEVGTLRPACVVMDVKMPRMDGVELQRRLHSAGLRMPVVIVTGYADVPTAVVLMKQGAETLIEKPYEPALLIARVRDAVAKYARLAPLDEMARRARRAIAQLTDEEREILQLMVTGVSNKAIVAKLSISPRTLDRRRSHILEKMGVESVPQLANLVGRANSIEEATWFENPPS